MVPLAIGERVFAGWMALSLAHADCSDVSYEACAGATTAVIGIGAGIGASIDFAIKGKSVVYRAPHGPVSARPVFLEGGRGLGVALRF
jgi:hypothetical protein